MAKRATLKDFTLKEMKIVAGSDPELLLGVLEGHPHVNIEWLELSLEFARVAAGSILRDELSPPTKGGHDDR